MSRLRPLVAACLAPAVLFACTGSAPDAADQRPGYSERNGGITLSGDGLPPQVRRFIDVERLGRLGPYRGPSATFHTERERATPPPVVALPAPIGAPRELTGLASWSGSARAEAGGG